MTLIGYGEMYNYKNEKVPWENVKGKITTIIMKNSTPKQMKRENKSVNGITSIGENAFEGMTKLETIIISETVKIIKSKSFKDCVSLKEIIIPKSVENIEYDSFEGCTSLKKIEYKGKTDPCSDGSKIPSGTQIYMTKEYEGETFCGIREIEKICNEYNKIPNGTLETLLLFSKYNSNFFENIHSIIQSICKK